MENYTEKQLEKVNFHDLRRLGQIVGVKSACSLKKAELIDQILKVQNGEIDPYFSTKGRPAKKELSLCLGGYSKEKIKNLELLAKRMLDIISTL